MSSATASRYLWPVIWSTLGTVALVLLLVVSETAREVALDTAAVLISIFATPFILETSIALILLLVVLTYNQWKRNKDGDDWVYMVTHEDDSSEAGQKLPKAITQRLQGVLLPEKPEVLDEAQAVAGVIEGYLELGMPSQALDDLHRVKDLPDTPASAILRFRVLGANLATEPALSLLRDAAERFPDARPHLAAAAQEVSRWIGKHMHGQAKAQTAWQTEADLIAQSLT